MFKVFVRGFYFMCKRAGYVRRACIDIEFVEFPMNTLYVSFVLSDACFVNW